MKLDPPLWQILLVMICSGLLGVVATVGFSVWLFP